MSTEEHHSTKSSTSSEEHHSSTTGGVGGIGGNTGGGITGGQGDQQNPATANMSGGQKVASDIPGTEAHCEKKQANPNTQSY